MRNQQLDELILQLESHIECWKQFNQSLAKARTKNFSNEDEEQFLEVKSVLAQGLECIIVRIETGAPPREEIHSLLGAAPSIRYLSELTENSLRTLETQWHKVFLSWQGILGQLKVQQRDLAGRSWFRSLFGSK